MAFLDRLKQNMTSWRLSLLVCLLGTGSWVEINGIWVELPLLVSQSPQQWSLPSYLTIVIQLANIGPILYFITNKYVKRNGQKLITEIPVIYGILTVGVVASFLLAFLWKETNEIGGNSYSTALIVLSFFLATVDCTSSLTFLPFMAYFPQNFMTAFYVGEGMSGFLPSIIALIQGVGEQSYTCSLQTMYKNTTIYDPNSNSTTVLQKNVTENVPNYIQSLPRFSSQIFFLFISAMMLCSLVAFIFLVREKNKRKKSTSKEKVRAEYKNTTQLENLRHNEVKIERTDSKEELSSSEKALHPRQHVIFLLIMNALINGLSNGVLPALQSFACLPYSFKIYHLTLALSAFVNPLACFMYFFVSLESTVGIIIGICVYLISAGYTIGVAATSPCPLLNDSDAGGVVVLLVTVFGVGLVSYLKTAISSVLRKHGYKELFWCGISVQIGSLIGALVIFPMVNVYGLFKQSVPCQSCL